MGYDIDLRDPVSKETIDLPVEHMMHGNMYPAEYDRATGTFKPIPTAEAHLGVTYNYSHYYYEATEDDVRFYGYKYDDSEDIQNLGIRGIYGKTGAESIQMLKDMADRIEERYRDDNGQWIDTERTETRYIDENGNEVEWCDYMCALFDDNDKLGKIRKEEYTEVVNEGVNKDYWKATAGNAIRPLRQLIAMAQLRPDGIWGGD